MADRKPRVVPDDPWALDDLARTKTVPDLDSSTTMNGGSGNLKRNVLGR